MASKTNKASGKTNPCLCGCKTKVRGHFAQGHDQRVRGFIVRNEIPKVLAAAIRAGLVLQHLQNQKGGNQRILRAS